MTKLGEMPVGSNVFGIIGNEPVVIVASTNGMAPMLSRLYIRIIKALLMRFIVPGISKHGDAVSRKFVKPAGSLHGRSRVYCVR